ncbi:Centrosomal protein [Halotydeus destructor]|nr:Centrosomal protein [Halotydeus destructor]
MDLDGSHLIVVAVIEGKNFECPGDHDSAQSEKRKYVSYMEARFNGEVLVSDAIELRSSEPQYNTELAWELDRKSLHLFRIERTPIKLQCFIEDTERQVKRFVGYLVLDLRTAQDEKNTKFAWKPLLNSKYRGPSHMRPELLCSLQLLKGDNGNTQKALLSPPKNYISSLENATANMFENDLRVKVSNGYHKIWDSKKV